ncbi:MAG: hypothetical protein SGJ19_14615 [Planctomycetia bacterium]|nr:hypothetical protein [Planctomycetia bacterium]
MKLSDIAKWFRKSQATLDRIEADLELARAGLTKLEPQDINQRNWLRAEIAQGEQALDEFWNRFFDEAESLIQQLHDLQLEDSPIATLLASRERSDFPAAAAYALQWMTSPEAIEEPASTPIKLSAVAEEYRRAWEEWQRDYPDLSANEYAKQWARTDKKKRAAAGKKARTAGTLTRAWRNMKLGTDSPAS